MTIAIFLAIGIMIARRRHLAALGSLRRVPGAEGATPIVLAELTALGLSAGLSFAAAVDAAAQRLPDDEARRVRRRLRSGVRSDTPTAADGLLALVERAEITGAPLLASIDGYATRLRREARASAVERARRLPVKLLFPLALLILPGFLLLTVAPAFLAGLDRLGL
jgi:tight adherence protein C